MTSFDPNAATCHDTLFGLPPREDATVHVLPVPFDATASFERGTADAWRWLHDASQQVDLFHPHVSEPWREGIVMADVPVRIAELNRRATQWVEATRAGRPHHHQVNACSDEVASMTEAFTEHHLSQGHLPILLGGDHSIPLGGYRAAVSRHPKLGILHIDAHADLREAYEGFHQSHASIFYNSLQLDIGVLVQVGIRDLCEAEATLQRDEPRVTVLSDEAIATCRARGRDLVAAFETAVAALPDEVWISVDIDGLDPSLCPRTGTPVPGGLSWREFRLLMRVVGQSGRRIVGCDLCEVGPSTWDANVGARVLFELWCWGVASRR